MCTILASCTCICVDIIVCVCVCCREQPEGEEAHPGGISSASLSDLMDKMRYRAARGSMSRDTSIASNLSELVTSPLGNRRFFRREDSVCSNISGVSDLAPSECSEMSLDMSVQEDLASRTFTCFNDIEHELDDLKSSMKEMDEEVTKFATRPDPYSFKTTFSDYSIGSGESRPSSAMEILSAHRSRASLRLGLQAARPNMSSDSEVLEAGAGDASTGSNQFVSGSEAEGSLEWDSPQHGWSTTRAPPLSKLPEMPSEDAESSRASVQVRTITHGTLTVTSCLTSSVTQHSLILSLGNFVSYTFHPKLIKLVSLYFCFPLLNFVDHQGEECSHYVSYCTTVSVLSCHAVLMFHSSPKQDDAMPSLEWDNGCLRQYEDEPHLQDANEQVLQSGGQDRYACQATSCRPLSCCI